MDNEVMFAFLSDFHDVCEAVRMTSKHVTRQEELLIHANVHASNGNSQVSNRGGMIASLSTTKSSTCTDEKPEVPTVFAHSTVIVSGIAYSV